MTKYNTGDMLLFKGNSRISRFITLLPSAEFSHVGFYYDHDLFGPCVFESTSIGNDPDVFTGSIIAGVQVTKFKDRIANYDGEVFVRRLPEPLTETQLSVFNEFVKKHHGTPYEDSNWQLIKAQLDGIESLDFKLPWHRNEQDESTLFCSELGVKLDRELEIIEDDGSPTNESTPTDCSTSEGRGEILAIKTKLV